MASETACRGSYLAGLKRYFIPHFPSHAHTCGLDPGANASVGAVLGAGTGTGADVAAEGEEEGEEELHMVAALWKGGMGRELRGGAV